MDHPASVSSVLRREGAGGHPHTHTPPCKCSWSPEEGVGGSRPSGTDAVGIDNRASDTATFTTTRAVLLYNYNITVVVVVVVAGFQ